MDWQSAFNIAFAIGGALGGWVLKTLHAEIKDARNDHANLMTNILPNTYARKDSVERGFDTIQDMIGDMSRDMKAAHIRFEEKLDRKTDK
jgi:hypothetical protein